MSELTKGRVNVTLLIFAITTVCGGLTAFAVTQYRVTASEKAIADLQSLYNQQGKALGDLGADVKVIRAILEREKR